MTIRESLARILRWSQHWTRTDMIYIARGGFWSSAGFFISSLLSLFLYVGFANFLAKETYGLYKFIMSVAGAIGFLTLTGMNPAVTREVARGYAGALRHAVNVQLRWNFLFLAGSVAVAAFYALRGNLVVAGGLLILGVTIPLTSAYNTYGAYLQGKREFKRIAKYTIGAGIIYVAAMGGMIAVTDDVLALITVYALATLLPSLWFYRQIVGIVPPADSPELNRSIAQYGAHMSVNNVLSVVAQHLDKIATFHFLGALELAVYGFATLIPDRLKGFIKLVTTVAFPKLASKNPADIAKTFYLRLVQSAFLGLGLAAGYVIAVPILFRIAFPAYADSVFYSQLIAINFIFVFPATYGAYVFQSQRLVKPIYISSTTINLLRITFLATGGAFWGLAGIIGARIAGNMVAVALGIILWRRTLLGTYKAAEPPPEEYAQFEEIEPNPIRE